MTDEATKPKHIHELRGITFQEYGALLGTRAMLQAGTVVWEDGKQWPKAGKHLFNMSVVCRTAQCGTVGCIGGTMGMIMGLKHGGEVDKYVEDHRVLADLFYPTVISEEVYDHEWSDITAEMGVQAITNFINTGNPEWENIVEAAGWERKRDDDYYEDEIDEDDEDNDILADDETHEV